MYEACYGPKNVKIFANYELVGKGGWFPQRNGKVISCSLYSIRTYVRRAANVACSGLISVVRNGKVCRTASWPVRTTS